MNITVTNPATGLIDNTYPLMDQAEVDAILQRMDIAQKTWAQTALQTKIELMQKAAVNLSDHKQQYAAIITAEMGKPISQAVAEIEKCASLCDYYCANVEDLLQDKFIKTDNTKSYVCYRPLGVIFAIMPWNFPFWQVLRFAVPNLLAGNAVALSHAPNSIKAALCIETIFKQAGFPEDLFRSLIVEDAMAERIINNQAVKGATLTGSAHAGKAIAKCAGKALKKVVLELGGSDPYIILEDADLELAATACVVSRLNNAGQVCIAAKRIIAVDAVRDKFEKLILEKAKAYVCGDPMDAQTTLGPMAREDLRQKIHDQVQRCIQSGARCVLGGEIIEGPGFYYPATVLFDVKQDSPAFTEELFGPVICVISAKDENEAIELANISTYGLGAAVFTKNVANGEDIAANKLHAGTCVVNCFVESNPHLPFGGINQSGFGRELSREGIHEFMNIKTIVLK